MRWFLAGLGVGTVVGMVVAPKPGVETREELLDAAKSRLSDARETIEPYVEQAREKIEPAIQQVRERAEPMMEKGRTELEAAGDRISKARAGMKGTGLLEILNEWSHERLIEIDGIGPILATKIIQNRPYESEDDLLNSKSLPPSAIENLKRAS
jgi:DNA uptake protein ComE-like DNA-binding protein